MELKSLRDQIDGIDAELIRLLEDRMKLTEQVADYKIKAGKAVYDPAREKEKIERASAMVRHPENQEAIGAILNQIMAVSRTRQYERIPLRENEKFGFRQIPACRRKGKVVYQGTMGAYGHQAVLGYFGKDADCYPVSSFENVMKDVRSGKADFGVLPAENTSTGIINDVYDLTDSYDICISGQYVVKVEHVLLGLPGSDLSMIRTIYSHPQGLMQCSDFLSCLPAVKKVTMLNTAVSAMHVQEGGDPTQAAIASPLAGQYYGLDILQKGISNNSNNSTKFIIIQKDREFTPDADGISIKFELAHTSGTLYRILGFIIFNHLNMSMIESRPVQGEKWRYRFYIDLDGNLDQPAVRDALLGIAQEAEEFHILGNYRKAQ